MFYIGDAKKLTSLKPGYTIEGQRFDSKLRAESERVKAWSAAAQ